MLKTTQNQDNVIGIHTKKYSNRDTSAGFDLKPCDLYIAILVEVFTNHISAENTCLTNHLG